MKVQHVIAGLPFVGNLGVVALAVNFAVTALVSTATRSGDAGRIVREDEPRFSRTAEHEPAERARARPA